MSSKYNKELAINSTKAMNNPDLEKGVSRYGTKVTNRCYVSSIAIPDVVNSKKSISEINRFYPPIDID